MTDRKMLVLPALGRSFALGELYDARSDNIGPGYLETGISEDYTRQEMTQTCFESFSVEDISEMASHWDISADLRVAMLTQSFKVGGAVSYLKRSSMSRRTACSALRFSLETETRQLKKDCNAYLQGHTASACHATHFVCKILYGAEAFFIFEEKSQTLARTKSRKGELHAKVDVLPVGMSAGAMKCKDSVDTGENFRCLFYGDFKLDRLPTSYEEAEALCKEIPKKMEPPHGIPVRVWLQPLPGAELLYRDISPHIAIRMQKSIEDLDEVLERLKSLTGRDICIAFPAMLGLVKQAEKSIAYFSQMFKKDLGEFRSQIKHRERDENTAADVLDRLEMLPLDIAKMKAWVEARETEAGVLEEVTNYGKLVQKAEASVKCRVFLEVRIHSKKLDTYIQQLQKASDTYVKLDRGESSLQMDIPEFDWKQPCSAFGSAETKHKLEQFQCCYEKHSGNNQIGFEVREIEPSKPGEEGTSLGMLDRDAKVLMPAEPDQLLPCPIRNLKISRLGTFCWIKWEKELQGHILVTNYMVKYRKCGTDHQYVKRVDSDKYRLSLRGSKQGKPYDIEVIPCCGDLVQGPSSTTKVQNVKTDSYHSSVRENIAVLSDGRIVGTDPEAGKIVFGSGRNSHAIECLDWSPGGVATTSDDRILVSDMENDSIRVIDGHGETLEVYDRGKDGESFQCPWDVATDEKDNIYVLDNLSVQMLDRNGNFQKLVLGDLPGNIGGFATMLGRLAITDKDTNTCDLYTTDGKRILSLPKEGDKLYGPSGVAMDDGGNVYVVDSSTIIRKYGRNGDAVGSMKAHWKQGAFTPGAIAWSQSRGLVASDVDRDICWEVAPDDLKECSGPEQYTVKISSA